MTLTDKVNNEKFIILEELTFDQYKTKELNNILKKLPAENKKLIVLPAMNEKLIKSAHNLKDIKIILADSLNVFDILNSDYLIAPETSLAKIKEVYLKEN